MVLSFQRKENSKTQNILIKICESLNHFNLFVMQARRYDGRTTIFSPEGTPLSFFWGF
jgi:hypothetical protein